MSTNNFPVEVRNRIRKIRQLREYSQEYMGEQLGITQKGYSAIETGETTLTIERLSEIAKVLEIDMTALLAFDEKMLLFNHADQSGGFYGAFYGNISSGEIQEKYIQKLEDDVKYLKKQIEKLHKIIDKLGSQ